jgi:hypothetical protein
MTYWGKRNLSYKSVPQPPISLGDGVNTFFTPFEIKKSELSYARNISSRNYPALSVRPGRATAFADITTPNGLSQRNNEYPHVLDGTTWKRWDGTEWQTVASSMANAPAKFLEFNTEAKRYTVFADGTNRKSWDGTLVANLADAPATPLYAMDDYRLYALTGSVLKCSAEGSITDWTTADDADTILLTSMIGSGTAIAAYNDSVVCWSEQTMHVLFGNDPYDFYLSDPIEDGCISDRSVITHNGRLYFLDFGKYKVFTGGRPEDISQKVKAYLDNINLTYKAKCVAGKHGKYIYLSIPYGAVTTNNLTLEYDTELGNWYVFDEGYVDFVNIGEFLYGVASDGKHYKINSGTTNAGAAIVWSAITGVDNAKVLRQKKVISDIYVLCDLPVLSTLTVSYSTTVDGDDFTTLYTFTASANEQNTRIHVPTTALQNIDFYRLKFAGTGPCTIYYIEPHTRIKPR